MPSPARSRRAASPSASTSPTGETTPPSTNSNNHTTKQQTTNTNTTHPQAIAAAPSKPGQAPPHNQYLVTLVTFASILGTTATAIIGGMAALLSSKTFALVLWAFAPHADDLWGLKVVAAVLRLAYLGAVALRVLAAERPENPLPALGAALARLATTAAVECSVLFSQPAFATVAGGTFKVGDASKAAIGRFGRTAWLATTPQLSLATSAVLAAALAVAVADRLSMPSKALLRGYPRLAVSVVAKGAKTVCLAALYPRLRSLAISTATSVNVTAAFAALPPALLMSRHELSLFHWSFDALSIPLALVLAGDLCMSNAALPAPVGAAGALAIGLGLRLGGVAPTAGFYLSAAAWITHALCHLLLPPAPPAATKRMRAPWAVVEVKGGSVTKPTAAALSVRVLGWSKPVYRPLDTFVQLALVVCALLAKPSWTYAAGAFVVDAAVQGVAVVLRAAYAALPLMASASSPTGA